MKKIFILFLVLGLYAFKTPKQLFLLGDSISLQYGSVLEKYLKGDYNIQRKGSVENAMKNLDVPIDANGGDSRMVLTYLQTKLTAADFRPDLMLLNCGLHDVKRVPKTQQIAVDSNEYRKNLQTIFNLIANKHIPLIWVRTTEVVDSIHAAKSKAFDRYAKDVEQYNRIADEVCKQHHIAEIDLYNFTRIQGNNRFADHVHYIPPVINAQAAYIAGFIRAWEPLKH